MTFDEAFQRVEKTRDGDGRYAPVLILTSSEYDSLRCDPEALARVRYTNPPVASSGPVPHRLLEVMLAPPRCPLFEIKVQ